MSTQSTGFVHRDGRAKLSNTEDAFAGSTMVASSNDHANTDGMDITATQKMASAITGSLLTSLLGMLVYPFFCFFFPGRWDQSASANRYSFPWQSPLSMSFVFGSNRKAPHRNLLLRPPPPRASKNWPFRQSMASGPRVSVSLRAVGKCSS